MTSTEIARTKFQRADKFYHLSIKTFIAFVVLMLIVIAVEVGVVQGSLNQQDLKQQAQQEESAAAARARLQKALEETQKQQIVTQQYIRCVASVLLKPEAERTAQDFDACGIPGVTDPGALGRPQAAQLPSINQQRDRPIAPVAPSPMTQPNNEPTTSGPPPDDDKSPLVRLPLVGGLLDGIGL